MTDEELKAYQIDDRLGLEFAVMCRSHDYVVPAASPIEQLHALLLDKILGAILMLPEAPPEPQPTQEEAAQELHQ